MICILIDNNFPFINILSAIEIWYTYTSMEMLLLLNVYGYTPVSLTL